MRDQGIVFVRLLDNLAVWAGVAAALLILIAWRLVGLEARKRLKVAAFWLVAGAACAAAGASLGIRLVRLLGVIGIAVAVVRTTFVLLFDLIPFFRRTPKIVRDINAGVVYFLALMVALGSAGVRLESLVTTSALLTAVVGFALQDTLGNLVAGLAIQAQRPFSVGDWIQIEGSSIGPGRVLEINWRATKVETNDHVEVSFPNSVLAKTPVTNFSLPTAAARRSLFVQVGYAHAPDAICELLLEATRNTEGVLAAPPASVITQSFEDAGLQYWVRFFVDDWAERDVVDSRVWVRIWYALKREGIEVPFPTQTLHLHEVTDERERRAIEQRVVERVTSLRAVDFLAPLPDEDIRRLAEGLRVRHFAPGEVVLRQGDEGESLFLIHQGAMVVLLAGPDGTSAEMARLEQGQFFGEMSLMTGEPRTATVRSDSRAELYEIDRDLFASVLLGHEEVAQQMSAILTERQLRRGERGSATGDASPEARTQALFSRIKRFFRF